MICEQVPLLYGQTMWLIKCYIRFGTRRSHQWDKEKFSRAAQVRIDVGLGGFHTVANTHSAEEEMASRHAMLHL